MSTFLINTFGCQMNVADSDWLSRSLKGDGWKEVFSEEEARAIVINTCSVREKPEQKVYSLIGRYRDRYEADPDFFVAVGGCVAQQVGTSLWERFPYVRLIFGTDGLAMVPQAMGRIFRSEVYRTSFLDFCDHYPERTLNLNGIGVPAQAFVTIMQGCDNFCAYCIVPFVRGRQKSRKSSEIIDECTRLIEKGVKEITLLGQNVNSYGLDDQGNGKGFAELLTEVGSLPGLKRLRFTTSHPKDLAEEVIEAFSTLETLCPQLHLPVQSGSDRMLKTMGRKYTRQDYLDKVAALRNVCPEIALSTDLIVGFPGEDDQDFRQTLDLMEAVRFDSSFSFKYCDRPGVRSEKMTDKIDEKAKAHRLQILQDLQKQHTELSLEKLTGKTVEVLVEGRSRKGDQKEVSWMGRDPGGRVVNFECHQNVNLTGRLVWVNIQKAKKHSLWGSLETSL